MSFYSEMEKIIDKHGEDGLIHLEHYYGIDLELYRQVKNSAYSTVHGRDAGQPASHLKNFIGILQSDDFFPANSTQAPAFEAGFLHTRELEILVGDVIKIVSNDDRNRRYRIIEIDSIGLTQQVYKRYKLSALGD